MDACSIMTWIMFTSKLWRINKLLCHSIWQDNKSRAKAEWKPLAKEEIRPRSHRLYLVSVFIILLSFATKNLFRWCVFIESEPNLYWNIYNLKYSFLHQYMTDVRKLYQQFWQWITSLSNFVEIFSFAYVRVCKSIWY